MSRPARRRGVLPVIAAVAALALSAWEGTVTRASAAAHWSVLGLVAVALVAAAAAGRRRQRQDGAEWARRIGTALRHPTAGGGRPWSLVAGTATWVVLAAATIGWDLTSFVHQAHDLPTLSRLIGDVTGHDWGRALVFAAWLALGAFLAAGGRRAEEPAERAGTEGGGTPGP